MVKIVVPLSVKMPGLCRRSKTPGFIINVLEYEMNMTTGRQSVRPDPHRQLLENVRLCCVINCMYGIKA